MRLLELLVRLALGAVVSHGRHPDEHVRAGKRGFDRAEHLPRARDVDAFDARRRRQRHGPAHEHDVRAGGGGRLGEREALFARAVVRNEAHGVDRLAGGTGGDHEAHAREGAAVREQAGGVLDEGLGLEHAPRAELAARLIALGRPPHVAAVAAQLLDVAARGGRFPHAVVHRRRQGDRRRRGEAGRGQQIVGEPGRETREEVGARRRDQEEIRPPRELDVAHRGLGGGVEQVVAHRAAGERLEGQRPDELHRRGGRDDLDLRAALAESADELRGFVRRDAPRHAEQQVGVLERLHEISHLLRYGRAGKIPSASGGY